MTSHLRW